MKRLVMLCIAVVAVLSFTFSNSFADSPRMSVVEQFTATWCGPCGNYSPPFHAELKTRSDKVIPIIYHGSNDKMGDVNLPMYQTRGAYYSVSGIPHALVNGGITWKGNPGNLSQVLAAIDGVNETSPFDIEVGMTREGNSCNATVKLNSSQSTSDLTLFVGVVEYHILNRDLDGNEAASNGETEFHWVARKLLPSDNGEAVDIVAGEEQNFSYDFPWNAAYKDGNIYTVAFLQNMTTKEIMQGATSLKTAAADLEVAKADQYSTAGRESSIEKTVTVKNPNDFDCDMALTYDVNNDWTVSFSKETVSLAAGASEAVTVTVNTDANASFATINVTATPANTPDGYVVNGKTEQMMVLTEDAKYATLATSTSGLDPYFTAIEGLDAAIQADWIVADAVAIATYYSSFDFEIVHVLVGASDYMAWGVDGALEGLVNNRIDMGKYTLVTSNLGLLVHSGQLTDYGYVPSGDLKNLYNNKLGITLGNSLALVQDNQLYTMGVVGEGSDPISQDLEPITLNSTYNTLRTYSYYIETMKLTGASDAKPFLKYDNSEVPADEYAGIYVQDGDAKTVYLGFPIEVSTTGGAKLLANIVDWFMGGEVVEEAKIAVSEETIAFESIEAGTTSNETLTITNNGNIDLTITAMELSGDAFSMADVTLPLTIEAGATYDVEITFAPTAAGEFAGSVAMASNAANEGQTTVALTGTAVASSVVDVVKSMTVAPNPANTVCNVELNTTSVVDVTIYDMNGNVVDTFKASGSFEWNVNNVAAGTYLVNAGSKTVKVQVTK
jgi:hypothetical protein